MCADPVSERHDKAARAVVDSAYHVHRSLGPGLLESVYETCLAHEIQKRGVPFRRQAALPVTYDGVQIEAGMRLDLVVDDCLIIEVKAVEKLIPIHHAQLMTYLKLSGFRLGLLINFNVVRFKDGVKRIAL